MQNPIQKYKQSSIVFEKFENFGEFQLPYSSIIFALTLHTFPTCQCRQKDARDFFYFV